MTIVQVAQEIATKSVNPVYSCTPSTLVPRVQIFGTNDSTCTLFPFCIYCDRQVKAFEKAFVSLVIYDIVLGVSKSGLSRSHHTCR